MAKKNARLLLVKMGNGASPVVYSTVCGLTQRTFTINAAEVDVTSIDCQNPGDPVWREMIDGIRSITVSGNGFFENSEQSKRIVNAKLNGDGQEDFQIVVPGVGTFEGRFQIGEFAFTGELEGALTQNLNLASSGKVTFTEEVAA